MTTAPQRLNTTTTSIGGQTARLFDFQNFDLVETQLRIVGSAPAVIAASGTFNINGALLVTAGGGAGGLGAGSFANGLAGSGAAGGGGSGGVAGQNISGGGGGANVSPGQNGNDGTQHGYQPWINAGAVGGYGGLGGAANPNPGNTILSGGGGAGGGYVTGPNGFNEPGSNGGAGGGGILFLTLNNFTVGSTGTVSANGQSVPYIASQGGGGGGGAGGTILFNVSGTFDNEGLISARGGAGGTTDIQGNSTGGAGSGGVVGIDPLQIINNGTIDVCDGLHIYSGVGNCAFGGRVDTFGTPVTGKGVISGLAPSFAAAVPEPETNVMLLAGLGLLGFMAHRRKQQSAA